MAANETIDKLKSAGYITVTADSQGIADQCQIGGGSSEIDEYLEENNIEYKIEGNDAYGMYDDDEFHVSSIEIEGDIIIGVYFGLTKSATFYKNKVNFHSGDSFTYIEDDINYAIVVISDFTEDFYSGDDILIDADKLNITTDPL